ncbi:MAG: HlyU family transcriptional regulator [Roseobacter sp.]
MSFLKKLFGGGSETPPAKTESEDYEGYRITVTPIAEGTSYRVAATIEKEIDGETKEHKLIRADTVQGKDEAEAASLRKAKQVIDEQGDRIFR